MSEMKNDQTLPDHLVVPALAILAAIFIIVLFVNGILTNEEPKEVVHNRVTVECVFGLSRLISEDYKDATVNTNDVRHMIKVDGNYYLFPIQNCLVEVIH